MTLRLNGSSSGYTEIDAPAAAGSNTLTLPTGNGSAGQVLSTNGSGVLSFVNAITEVDQWYLTADLTADGNITTNLARNNHEGATFIGTGMSESSGIFSFPSTGKYLILVFGMFACIGGDSVNLLVDVTLDNSSYNLVAFATAGNGSGVNIQTQGSTAYFLDVTDTSAVKVRFGANNISSGSAVKGDSGRLETNFVFIRLGDT